MKSEYHGHNQKLLVLIRGIPALASCIPCPCPPAWREEPENGLSQQASRARDSGSLDAVRQSRCAVVGRLEEAGRVCGAREGAGHDATGDRGGRESVGAARSRRRRISDGREVVLHE